MNLYSDLLDKFTIGDFDIQLLEKVLVKPFHIYNMIEEIKVESQATL